MLDHGHEVVARDRLQADFSPKAVEDGAVEHSYAQVLKLTTKAERFSQLSPSSGPVAVCRAARAQPPPALS
eukprot:6776768-Pyramimonas_sp.AAC.1